ncbi:unnamed protein product [Effrenium voratum]|uniref:tRNA pseudouridine synthase n=1 Tax=Effrenium voratum TaxID=2562239 RepID=A0AA36JAB1_9DINO|nr:unnamed protein product [Effrenium voratum]
MALARGRFRGLRFAGSAVLAVLGVPSCALQRWKMQVAYDGSSFYGWQHQESRRSVHGVLLAALTASHPQHSASRQRPKLVGCSRTDRGVHAEAQVAHCDLLPLEPSALLQRVNRRLPGDVRVLALEPDAWRLDGWARAEGVQHLPCAEERVEEVLPLRPVADGGDAFPGVGLSLPHRAMARLLPARCRRVR